MSEMSDELLMAYADGALDQGASAQVEAAIQRHPQYAEKVEKFRATRGLVQEAFQEEPGASHLQSLIDRIGGGEVRPAVTAETSAARVVWIGANSARRALTGGFLRPRLPVAMAASIALLIGAGLGWLLRSQLVVSPPSSGLVTFSDGRLLAQGALQGLLETAGSGTPAVVKGEDGGAWTLKATFTFRTASQTPCRRYEISDGAAHRFAGYACRSGEGVWLVRAHADLNTNAPKDGGFAPAARGSEVALDAAIRAAMDGDVYQLSEEQQLLASRWASIGK